MYGIGKNSARREAPPGTYLREDFTRALTPLFRALELHPSTRENMIRALSISRRLYAAWRNHLALEDVYDIAEYFGDVADKGQLPLDVAGYVFEADERRLRTEAHVWKHKAHEYLRHKGYVMREREQNERRKSGRPPR